MNPNNLIRIVAIGVLMVLTGCGEKGAADKQMQELCAKDGGAKIYETVTLPASDFGSLGQPLDQYWSGQSDPKNKLGPNFRYIQKIEFLKQGNTIMGEVQMIRSIEKIYRRSDDKLLAESIEYGRSGGDPFLIRMLGGHPSSSRCPLKPDSLLLQVFIK